MLGTISNIAVLINDDLTHRDRAQCLFLLLWRNESIGDCAGRALADIQSNLIADVFRVAFARPTARNVIGGARRFAQGISPGLKGAVARSAALARKNGRHVLIAGRGQGPIQGRSVPADNFLHQSQGRRDVVVGDNTFINPVGFRGDIAVSVAVAADSRSITVRTAGFGDHVTARVNFGLVAA